MVDENDIARLKEIFVTRQECNSANEEIKNRLQNYGTKLAVMEQQLNTVIWVSKTTLGAVIVAIIGAVMALVLK